MTTTTYTNQGKKFLEQLQKIAEDSQGNDIKKIRTALKDLEQLQNEVDNIIKKFKNTYKVNNNNVPAIMNMNKWAKPKNFEGLEKILSAAQLKTVREDLDIDSNGKFEADEQKFALELYNSVGGDIDRFMKKVKNFKALTTKVHNTIEKSSFARTILQRADVRDTGTRNPFTIKPSELTFIDTIIKKFLLEKNPSGTNISREFGEWSQKATIPKFSARSPTTNVLKNFPSTKKAYMTRKLGEFENKSLFTMYSQNRRTGDSEKKMSDSSSLSNVYGSLPKETQQKLNTDLKEFYTRNRKNKTLNAFLNFIEKRRKEAEEIEERITAGNTRGGKRGL